MPVGVERRRSRRVFALGIALGWLAAPAPNAAAQEPDPEEYSCGPSHQRDIQEILHLRDPGARSNSADLSLDRALVITDFLRLSAEGSSGPAGSLRGIDEAALRRARDGGYITPEVCAVVRFMHGYYARGQKPPVEAKPQPQPARIARRPQREEALPDVASAPAAQPERPPASAAAAAAPVRERVARRDLQAEAKRSAAAQRPPPAQTPSEVASPIAAPPATPTKPPPDPVAESIALAALENQRAERARVTAEADAEVRRAALVLIAEIDGQLKVPPYLSFRETRTEANKLSEDEVEARQAAALRATERLVAILTRLSVEPGLRDAVQVSLGPDGRARVENGIVRSLKNLPDDGQRSRALTLWSELEASASQKR